MDDLIIQKIIQRAKQNRDIDVLWLYGSRAVSPEKIRSDSDYDLAIAFKTFPKDSIERHTRPEILALEWAHALEIPEKQLSIVDINLVPIPLAWEIVFANHVLHAKDPLRQIQEENRIYSAYEIDILFHRQHYAA